MCTASGVLTAALASLAGCSALAVRLGLRVRLDTVPVTAITASLVNGSESSPVSALGPGQSARLVISATAQDGKQFVTVGAGHGKVAFDNYTITATIVQVGTSGKVSMPADPRASDDQAGQLHIVTIAHPEVVADVVVPVRYDIAFVADFSGAGGINGADGFNGTDGSPGTDGTSTIDPATGLASSPGPGGRGWDGGNGQDGSNGGDGEPGQTVHIWMRQASAQRPLLQVKAASLRKVQFFLVDPNGGSLKVMANGGPGGRGGSGGRGGRGGSGGNGSPPGPSGMDGAPGSDGRPGSGGAAGTIAVSVDPEAQRYLSSVTLINRTGSGSPGPQPEIRVEPVSALW